MVLKGHPQQVPFLLCKGAGMSPVENIIHRHQEADWNLERKNDTRYLCAGTQECIMKTMATRGGAAVKNVHKNLGILAGLMSVLSVAANAQWVKTSGPWSGDASCLQCHYATALAASGGTVVAGTYAGGVFLSLDNGTSWTGIDSGLTNDSILSLAASSGSVFAGTHGGGVFHSANNGTFWTAADSGLTNRTVLSLAASGGSVFAGTHGGGVFLSVNNGARWTAINTGLTNAVVTSLAISRGTIFAGTDGGVWRRPLLNLVGVVGGDLRQKAREPKSGGFKISIRRNSVVVSLPESLTDGAATVTLFTIAGKRVYSSAHQAYNGALEIPVAGLSLGMYLMSITGGNAAVLSSFVVTK